MHSNLIIDSAELPKEEETPAVETPEEKEEPVEKVKDSECEEAFLEEKQEEESSEDLVDENLEDIPDESKNEGPEAEGTDKGESAEEAEIEEPEEDSTEESGEKEPVSEIPNELDNETPHTINFTFNDQTRCIPIGTIKKELSQIISDIGIEGEIIDVTVYNDENCENPSDKNTVKSGETELFKAYEKDGAWYLDSLNPFTATYGLFVTTTEGKYKVNVSDPDAVYYLNPVYNDATDTSPGTAASGIKGWQTLSCIDYVVVGQSTNTWGTAGSDTWYVVNTNITLSDVEVRGNVHLILLDGTSLTSNGSTSQHAGIFVINTSEIYSSLTIYAGNTSSTIAGTGSLSAMGNVGAAGIGGSFNCSGKNIIINGGIIETESRTGENYGAAGIGGGDSDTPYVGTGENIIINGGTVTAKGYYGAAIGGGKNAAGSGIIINGGTVTAESRYQGAGIGGGYHGDGHNIIINNGKVTTTVVYAGAGIGGGYRGHGYDIHINGGSISATAGQWYGIGIGYGGLEKDCKCWSIFAKENITVRSGINIITHDDNTDLSQISDFKFFSITISSPLELTAKGTVVNTDKTYDGNTTVVIAEKGTLARVDGETLTDSVTFTVSATYDDKNAGEGKLITVSYTLDPAWAKKYQAPASYKITTGKISQKNLSVTGTTATKVYDGNADASVTVGDVTGIITGDAVTVSGSGTFSGKDVREESIAITYSLSGDDSKNYVAPSGEIVTAKITQKHLGVNGTTVESTRVYDATTNVQVTNDGTLEGIIGSEEVTLGAVSATVADKNIGNKTVTVVYTLEGKDKGNYTVADDTSKSITITAIQLTVTGTKVESTRVYDATTNVRVIDNGTLDKTGIIDGEEVILGAVSATVADKKVGVGKVVTVAYSLEGADAGNYAAADDTTKLVTIEAKQLTVNGTKVQDKIYDRTTTAQVIIGVVDFISGDNVSITATGTFDNEKPGENKDVTVVYSLKGADAGNYIKPSSETLQATIKGAAGNLTADEFSRLFTVEGENGNVKLTGDIYITDNSTAYILKGTHDLYLNGFNLYLNDSHIEISGDSSATTLNIYGGADRQTDGNGVISTNSQYDIKVLKEGILNIYSGTITSGKSGAIYAGPLFSFTSEDSGLVNVFGGTILSGNDQFCIYADGHSTVNIVGGTITGKLSKYRFGTIAVAGGTFIGVHPGKYLLKDDGRYCVEVRKETAPTERYVVYPVNWYNCVRILSSGSSRGKMTGHRSLSDAFNTVYATVVMLADSTADVTVNAYNIILDLNGFVLKSRSTASVLSVNDCRLTIKDTGRTRVHYFKVESSGLWTLLTSEPTTKAINYEDITGFPETGTVIAVKGGCITGASGYGVEFTTSGMNPQNLIVENGNFIGNSGGGIYVNDCPIEMTGGIISGNIASSGAGIYIDGNNSAKIKGGSISYNTVNQDNKSACGGGIYCIGDSLQIADTSISYNKAAIGGGIYAANGCVVDIEEDAIIKGNFATEIGGGVYADSWTFTITGGTIADNTAATGGGVYAKSDNFTITGGTIANNTATTGGGVYVNSGTFTFKGGIIYDNNARSGGGVYTQSGIITITGGTIANNTATTGGGVYVESDSFTLTGGTISDNKATTGGGVYVNSGTFTLIDGIIYDNNARSGGGVYVESGTITITGGTISDNTATTGGGVYCNAQGSVLVGGDAYLCGNTNGLKLASNLYLLSGKTVSYSTMQLSTGALIGVTVQDPPSGTSKRKIDDGNNVSCFFSDNLKYYIDHDSSGVWLVINPVTWTYAVTADNEITATCGADVKKISISGFTGSYDQAEHAASVTGDYDEVPFRGLYSVRYTISGTSSPNAPKQAGDYRAVLTLTVGEEYQIHSDTHISKIQITLKDGSIIAYSKVYDGSDVCQVSYGEYSGILTGDNVSVYPDASFPGKNVGSNLPVTVRFFLIGTDAVNYEVPGIITLTGSISKKQLTVGGTTVDNKVYDGTTTAKANIGIDNRAPGDMLTITATALFEDAESGENKIVHVTYAISGADADNYLVPAPTVCTASIVKPEVAGRVVRVVRVTIVDFDSLSTAQKAAIAKFLKDQNLSLVNIIEVEIYGTFANSVRVTVPSTVFEGADVKDLTIWKVHDDNTLTEAPFDIVEGVPVIRDGKPGLYILTVSSET